MQFFEDRATFKAEREKARRRVRKYKRRFARIRVAACALVQSGSSFEKIAGSGGATVTATHTRLASEDLSRAPLL